MAGVLPSCFETLSIATTTLRFASAWLSYFLNSASAKRRQNGSRPSPKILGAEVLARDVLDVGVDAARIDGAGLSVVVQVLEELMARDLRAALHDRGYPLVLDAKLPLFARLAREVETKDAAPDRDVLAAHGGEPVGLVFLGILGVADRISVFSRRLTIVASTFSRGSPSRFMSAATRSRSAGSAAANRTICSYLFWSRSSRHFGW
jgi:hypothetical protein